MLPGSTLLQAPSCSAKALSQVAAMFHALSRSKPLKSWVLHQDTDLDGLCVLSLPGLRTQVISCLVRKLFLVGNASFNLLGLGPSVSQVYCKSTVPGVPRVTYGKLISECDTADRFQHPGSQEDVVSNWKPAHS